MGLMEKWHNWRDLQARKGAANDAIESRNPENVKAAFANLSPQETDSEQKSAWLRAAIDQQDVRCFKEVLRYVDDPNLQIAIDKGGRYTDYHYYTPLSYALGEAPTHDISLLLAGDPRVHVEAEYLDLAKDHGMNDVATVLTRRMADVRRHEADLRLQEAAHLDQQAAAAPPAADPLPSSPAAETKPVEAPAEVWALMSPTSVARVTSSPALGRKLTDVFNFTDKERVLITENLQTGKETIGDPVKFEKVGAETLARAEEMLKSLQAPASAPKKFEL